MTTRNGPVPRPGAARSNRYDIASSQVAKEKDTGDPVSFASAATGSAQEPATARSRGRISLP